MSVQSAQAITVLFTTRVFATGVGTNADSLPTGTLYLNGTANGATVTITNVSTGLYKAAVTLPTLAIGDEVEIIIAATVSSIADTAVIWGDTKDLVIDASGFVTVTGLTASNLDTTISSRLASASYTAPDNASITTIKSKTNSLTFTVAGQVDSNIQYVNDTLVNGNGSAGTPWGP